ncbi:MAG: carbohydrate kinase family protein [Clostridia bacterium]|nr:carbohydrate kinase family protein [Clostridia bacterium]
MKILCVGQIVVDVAIKSLDIDDFEKGRSTIDSFEVIGGGDCNNAAIDLTRLGEEARPFGVIGNGFLGDRLIELYHENGIDTSFIRRVSEPTTVSVLILGKSGDPTLTVIRSGAHEALMPGDVTEEMIRWADHVHMVSVLNLNKFDGEGTGRVFEIAHRLGKTTSMDLKALNPALANRMQLVEKALSNCDVFLPSHYEVEFLCGIRDPEKAAEFFAPFGLKVFGCKMGAHGVFLTDYHTSMYLPSLYEGTPVDVIGAGDAFSSTFACAWKRGYDLHDAGVLASAASAFVLDEVGCTTGMKDFDTVLRYAKERGAIK